MAGSRYAASTQLWPHKTLKYKNICSFWFVCIRFFVDLFFCTEVGIVVSAGTNAGHLWKKMTHVLWYIVPCARENKWNKWLFVCWTTHSYIYILFYASSCFFCGRLRSVCGAKISTTNVITAMHVVLFTTSIWKIQKYSIQHRKEDIDIFSQIVFV